MAYRKALSLNDRAGAIHAYLARLLVVRGRPIEALEEVNKEPAEAWRTLTLPIVLDALGRKAEADAALERVTSRYGDQYAYQIALIYARATTGSPHSSGSTARTCNTMRRPST